MRHFYFSSTVRCVCLVLTLAVPAPLLADTHTVRAGEALQPVLDAARPGDIILLEAGATFTGNFVLPVKSGSTFITMRSAAADTALPAAGQRIGPEWASALPRLQSGNNASALRTAPGAHHWRLQFIEFRANKGGYGDIIALGDGSAAQNTLDKVPYDLELDRVYVHGDSLLGQKRGIALNARAVTIRDSYVSDCKAVGMDSQAIGGWNGPGPYQIVNNYLEGAGENVLFGGSDPAIAGLSASDITFTRNHLAKPVEWRAPIVATPDGLTFATGAGSLPAGRVTYLVTARRWVGQGTTGRSTAAAIEVDVPADGAVQLRWSGVTTATDYQVFGRGRSWTVSTPGFTDTGAGGTVATAPSGGGTRWTVKNIFELKNARRVTAEYNVFESNWQDGQAGYAIVFTPRNSGDQCGWCLVDEVTFQYNIVRHSAAAVNILGFDSPEVSGQAANIRIRHNLFYDISKRWGGNGWFLLIGDQPRNIVIDHNTIDHDGTSLVYAYGGTATAPRIIEGFQFTNNLGRHNSYGIGGASFGYGNAILAAYFPNALVHHNLFSGGSASRYPVVNYFDAPFASAFIDGAAGDYRLSAAGIAAGRASEGTHLGVDMTTLLAGVAEVMTGAVTSSAPGGSPTPTGVPPSPGVPPPSPGGAPRLAPLAPTNVRIIGVH